MIKKKLSKEMQGKIFFLKNKLDFIEFTFQYTYGN